MQLTIWRGELRAHHYERYTQRSWNRHFSHQRIVELSSPRMEFNFNLQEIGDDHLWWFALKMNCVWNGKLLLDYGANPSLKDIVAWQQFFEHGERGLFYLDYGWCRELSINDKPFGRSILHCACISNSFWCTTIIKWFKQEESISICSRQFRTLSAARGEQSWRYLRYRKASRLGSSGSLTDKMGRTPYH